MYCVHCGVKLADPVSRCPLCLTAVPQLPEEMPKADPLFPSRRIPSAEPSPRTSCAIATALFLLPAIITLLCDLRINHRVSWSGYVIGALVVAYTVLILPGWFRRPNPVVFVPCSFAAAAGYVLYIDLVTRGNWFLSFALPVIGFFCCVFTALAALLRYVHRGRLWVYGGTSLALGLFMPVMEYLILVTFHRPRFTAWSIFPLTALVFLGGLLIYLGICRSARETMERKFFI